MKINVVNCSSRTNEWLQNKLSLTWSMLYFWGVSFTHNLIKGDKPTDADFYLTNYSVLGGDKLWAVKYDFIKKQLFKLDDKDVGVITLVCVDPSPKTNCNYCFPDLNFLSLIPCMIVCDENCEHYMRHEIIHAINFYIKQQGINIDDTQDYDLVKAGLSYSISSPEAMAIEKKNLDDCLPYLHLLETPPKKFHLLVSLMSSAVALLTKLVEILGKKPSKTKAYFIDYARQMARKYFVDEKVFCAVIEAESSWNQNAKLVNKNGTTDWGICQFNDYWYKDLITPERALNDPEFAIELMAKQFQKGQENDWWAYRSGNFKRFLNNY